MDGDETDPSDTMRGRVQESRWKLWLLMNAPRSHVTALILGFVFVTLVATSLLDLTPMRQIVESETALWWVFSPMIGAIITGTSIVVTINQLVLSQELGPLGDQRDRMNGAMEFREDVRSYLDQSISPPDPASFLEAIIDGIQTYANRLEDVVQEEADDEVQDQVEDYVDSLTTHAQEVGDGLNEAQFGQFDVIFSALNFNYSWKIFEAQRLREEYRDDLSEDAEEALDNLVRVLEFFGPAREHFKTLYFQWELVNLSRVLLVSAVPALVVSVVMMVYVDTAGVVGTTLGIDHLVWLVCAAATATMVPFALFVSYILRIATVAKRTLAIGPFILRETERTDDIDWSGTDSGSSGGDS